DRTSRLLASKDSNAPKDRISITNSFGVPSKVASIWQEDVKRAISYEKKGDVLILSFMGTVKPGQTQDEFIEDFALAAKLANETGVKVLEANLSCPNIGNEGLVCYNLDVTREVCEAIRKNIGNTKLVLKVGYYKNQNDLDRLCEIAQKYAHAIASINTLQVEIVDEKGNQALPGKNRLKSGVCGAGIKWAGLEMVKRLKAIKDRKGYSFEIVGIGGVMTAEDFMQYRNAGADVVQSATGAMWNPYLAFEIAQKMIH
ncbi:MAG TPA: hypothetical protein VLF68_01800, partial [Candidatus Saccharimonadales bacterium]|nr:hypothetical protein [Candidatus Saccharimonadales bacterium]